MSAVPQATPAQQEMNIRRGVIYSRAYTYTRKVDGVPVVLNAADFDARLVVRAKLGNPVELLDLTDGDGLTLSNADDGYSIRIAVFLDDTETSGLQLGTNFVYTLGLTPVADPNATRELITAKASITDTALEG